MFSFDVPDYCSISSAQIHPPWYLYYFYPSTTSPSTPPHFLISSYAKGIYPFPSDYGTYLTPSSYIQAVADYLVSTFLMVE